jgi:hypothetical protein
MNPQKISRREWWLWFSALLVTGLSAIAFLLSSIRSFFRHADHFYEIRSDQARWATLCLLLVFSVWFVYRQWSLPSPAKPILGAVSRLSSFPATVYGDVSLDPVTGLYTRFGLEQHLGKKSLARRQNTALSLATVHVDEFATRRALWSERRGQRAEGTCPPSQEGEPGLRHCRAPERRRLSTTAPGGGVNEVKQVLNRLGPIEVNASREKSSQLHYWLG